MLYSLCSLIVTSILRFKRTITYKRPSTLTYQSIQGTQYYLLESCTH